MEKKKIWSKVLLAIMGVLILAELVASLLSASSENVLITLCKIIALAFIALYGFWLYKKPHGNMLKYAMLLVAATQIMSAAQSILLTSSIQISPDSLYLYVIWLFVSAALVYVAGRLNRIEQNKYILPVAAIVQFARTFVVVFSVADRIDPLRLLSWFSGTISIITLMIAYFVRYKEHKEAGIMEAPKK